MKTALAALLLAGTVLAAEPKTQTLDVYAPPDGKGRPVVVWIHGGGWQAGDKKEVNKEPQAFADKGKIHYGLPSTAALSSVQFVCAAGVVLVADFVHIVRRALRPAPARAALAGV